MSLNSINTNSGAYIALESLNATNAALTTTQNRVSSGLKVASAKDNAALFAIAQNERSQVTALDSVTDSLNRGQSVADTASAAGQSISDLVTQLKAKALAYSDTSNSTADQAAYAQEYASLYAQIATTTSNAGFDGVNLIDGSTGAVSALSNAAGTNPIAIAHQNLTTGTGGALAGIPATLTGGTVSTAQLASFDTALSSVNSSLSVLGTGSKQLANHLTFISTLQDNLNTGIGNLVDADVAKESANLTALQTKQQLGIQALSIANSSSSTLLSLFRELIGRRDVGAPLRRRPARKTIRVLRAHVRTSQKAPAAQAGAVKEMVQPVSSPPFGASRPRPLSHPRRRDVSSAGALHSAPARAAQAPEAAPPPPAAKSSSQVLSVGGGAARINGAFVYTLRDTDSGQAGGGDPP